MASLLHKTLSPRDTSKAPVASNCPWMKFPTMKHPNSTALINCESSPHVTTEKKAILYRGGKSQTVIFFRGQLKYIENTTTQASANNSRKTWTLQFVFSHNRWQGESKVQSDRVTSQNQQDAEDLKQMVIRLRTPNYLKNAYSCWQLLIERGRRVIRTYYTELRKFTTKPTF